MESLHIDDSWRFFNGALESREGVFSVPGEIRNEAGSAMEAHHYAFDVTHEHDALRVRFEFRLMPHSDVGLIFSAKAPDDFWLLHFPDCGQASRAQHFWAALSRMTPEGWLRIQMLDLVRRVDSTSRKWHTAEVEIADGSATAKVDTLGVFEASLPKLVEPGRFGLYLFGDAAFRNIETHGLRSTTQPWKADALPAKTWRYPCPDASTGRWQKPSRLERFNDGELLLHFMAEEQPLSGNNVHLFLRSTDDGETWDGPTEPGWSVSNEVVLVRRFPDDSLRAIISTETASRMLQSDDRGKTWHDAGPMELPVLPEGIIRLHFIDLLDLADGALLLIGYGRHGSTVADEDIHTWGSMHCRAFSSRSEDMGVTWSGWIPVDGTKKADGSPTSGNLDLTEVCIAEPNPGTVVALTRPIYSPWMWESWSEDSGSTWGACMRGPFPGYATPNLLRTSSGALIAAHRLPGCALNVSGDGGVTWSTGDMIDSAIWVMGSMVEVAPDVVLYVYHDSYCGRMRAQKFRVTTDRLEPVWREVAQ